MSSLLLIFAIDIITNIYQSIKIICAFDDSSFLSSSTLPHLHAAKSTPYQYKYGSTIKKNLK